MKNSTKFRPANAFELELIWKGLQKIGLKNRIEIDNQNFMFFIYLIGSNKKSQYPSVYLISKDISNTINKIALKNKIIAAGIYFGFIKKSIFHITIEGAEFLARNISIKELQVIVVTKEAEKSILYGNDISKGAILSGLSDFNSQRLLLIYNHLHELIALGKFKYSPNKAQKLGDEEVLIRNYIDKGYYLRKE